MQDHSFITGQSTVDLSHRKPHSPGNPLRGAVPRTGIKETQHVNVTASSITFSIMTLLIRVTLSTRIAIK
jgi:hypothetical protein